MSTSLELMRQTFNEVAEQTKKNNKVLKMTVEDLKVINKNFDTILDRLQEIRSILEEIKG